MLSFGEILSLPHREGKRIDVEDNRSARREKIEPSSPRAVQKTPEISQSFFDGQTIFLQIQDNETAKAAANALEDCGAVVITEMIHLADYVVSDKPIVLPKPTIRSRRFESMMGNGSIESTMPKVILLKQIPWIFRRNSTIKPISEKKEDTIPAIVVADARTRLAPNFKYLNMPNLHLQPLPKGVFMSPFDPVPPNIDELKQKILKLANRPIVPVDGPPAGGHCELCHTPIENPQTHRQTAQHQMYSDDIQWCRFDKESRELNAKFWD